MKRIGKKIIILVLLLLNVAITYRLININNSLNEIRLLYSMIKFKEQKTSENINYIIERQIESFMIYNYAFPKDFIVTDNNNKTQLLSDIVNDKVLVISFKEASCYSCINKFLLTINNTLNFNNTILLIGSSSKEKNNNYFNTYKFKYYFCDNSAYIFKTNNKLCLFTINNSLRINNIFFPSDNNMSFLKRYIKYINSKNNAVHEKDTL